MASNITAPALAQLAKLFQQKPPEPPSSLMSSILHFISSDGRDLIMHIPLLYPLVYFPMVCRVLAFLLLAPFALCIALDVTAYAIARTLHLSILPHRVPRSPPLDVMSMLPDSGMNTPLESYRTQEKHSSAQGSLNADAVDSGLRKRTITADDG